MSFILVKLLGVKQAEEGRKQTECDQHNIIAKSIMQLSIFILLRLL